MHAHTHTYIHSLSLSLSIYIYIYIYIYTTIIITTTSGSSNSSKHTKPGYRSPLIVLIILLSEQQKHNVKIIHYVRAPTTSTGIQVLISVHISFNVSVVSEVDKFHHNSINSIP